MRPAPCYEGRARIRYAILAAVQADADRPVISLTFGIPIYAAGAMPRMAGKNPRCEFLPQPRPTPIGRLSL
jgi:hypothetical protein